MYVYIHHTFCIHYLYIYYTLYKNILKTHLLQVYVIAALCLGIPAIPCVVDALYNTIVGITLCIILLYVYTLYIYNECIQIHSMYVAYIYSYTSDMYTLYKVYTCTNFN